MLADKPAVNHLIDYLTEARFGPGDRLPTIRTLSTRLKLRRNVVRDALLQGQALGLVNVKPRSGTFVQTVDFGSMVGILNDTLQMTMQQGGQNVYELMEARRGVEIELCRLAAQRRRPSELAEIRESLHALRAVYGKHPAYLPANEAYHLAIARMGGNQVLFTFLKSLLTLLRPWIAQTISERPPDREGIARDEQEHEAVYRAILAGRADEAGKAMAFHLKELTRWLAPHDKAARSPSKGRPMLALRAAEVPEPEERRKLQWSANHTNGRRKGLRS